MRQKIYVSLAKLLPYGDMKRSTLTTSRVTCRVTAMPGTRTAMKMARPVDGYPTPTTTVSSTSSGLTCASRSRASSGPTIWSGPGILCRGGAEFNGEPGPQPL